MRYTKLFGLIFLIIFLLNLELFVIGQQESSNEAYQAKKRKEWLRKVPLPKDAIELELKFSFPSEELVAKDIYLGNAWNISNDSSGNIFVSSRISSLSKERTGYVIIISAIKAIGDRIYVLHNVPRVKIFEFDKNGQQQSTYWYTRPYGYLVVDFIVLNKGNEKIFYILQKSPDNKIEVFSPKTK